MEIEETAKRENPVFHRTEVEFTLHHPGEKTPERASVRNLVADLVGGSADATVIDHMDTRFGRATTTGYAKVYDSRDHAEETEDKHMLVRNELTDEEAQA